MRGENLLVLLGHLVLGVFLQVAVFAGGGDGFGVLRDLLGFDDLVLFAFALVAFAGDEELLFFAVGLGGDERLDGREDFDEAGEERLFGELFEALIEEEGVREIAGGLGIGGGEEVADQVGVVAEDFSEWDAAGVGGLEGFVVDREEDRAEKARGDEVVEEFRELLRVAVLDDPEENRGAEVLLDLPAFEGSGEFVGVAVFNEEVDALGGELALARFEEGEGDVAGFDGVRLFDEVEEAALELDRDLFRDGGEIADVGDQGSLGGLERGDIDADGFGEVVADGGTDETLSGVDLVGIFDGFSEAGEDILKVGLDFFGLDGADELLGEGDAAAGGAGVLKLFENLVLGGDGGLAEYVALGLLGGDGDARVFGDGLLGGGPPFFEFLFTDDLGEGDLEVDGGGGVVVVTAEGFNDELGGVVGDQVVDLGGVGLFTNQKMFGREDFHGADAEGRVHGVVFLRLEIDDELQSGIVVGFDLAETPAAVDDIATGSHGLQLGF